MPKSDEKPPLFLIRSSAGKVNHLFPIGHEEFGRHLQRLDSTSSSSSSTSTKKPPPEANVHFGCISADGCLQIWDLLKRRPILTLDTHLPSTSWADLGKPSHHNSHSHNPDESCSELQFYLFSRKTGLYCQAGERITKHSLTQLPLNDTHCGFCKPVLTSSEVLVCPSGSDSIFSVSHPHSKKPVIERISVTGPITFLQIILGKDWVLVGTEDGKVSLVDILSSSVLATCDLNEFRTEPIDKTDGSIVPLCSDGGGETPGDGHYLVGTATEELMLLRLTNSPELASDHLKVEKVIRVHRRGTSCIKLRPDREIIVAAGWDTRIRIFSFPEIRQLTALSCHSMSVSSLLFLLVPKTTLKSKSMPESSVPDTSELGKGNPMCSSHTNCDYYLLSASIDSTVAVWSDISVGNKT